MNDKDLAIAVFGIFSLIIGYTIYTIYAKQTTQTQGTTEQTTSKPNVAIESIKISS